MDSLRLCELLVEQLLSQDGVKNAQLSIGRHGDWDCEVNMADGRKITKRGFSPQMAAAQVMSEIEED